MTTPPENFTVDVDKGRGSNRAWWIVGGLAAILAVLVVLSSLFFRYMSQPNPEWDSLQAKPDLSLHGTVAYFDDDSNCVMAVSASGLHPKTIMCIDQSKMTDPTHGSKEVGVHIHWLADDRLELTMWQMLAGSATSFRPEWQRIYDITTLQYTETPVTEIPMVPAKNHRPKLNPAGDELITSNADGRAMITLNLKQGQSRTLLDVQGNPESYRISNAFWSPDFKYVISDDYQVLITTIGATPVTRQITPSTVSFYGYDALAWYDVTASDLLQ